MKPKNIGELKWELTKAKYSKTSGYNSDIPLLSDEDLATKLEKGRTWLHTNQDNFHFNFYRRRFLVIEEEIRRRKLVKEAEGAEVTAKMVQDTIM